eukprot:12912954-Prorocentrum_lima.AAC.1
MVCIRTDVMGMRGCIIAPQFFFHDEKQIMLELHMDDVHSVGPQEELLAFQDALKLHAHFKGGDVHDLGETYEHLKRLRT